MFSDVRRSMAYLNEHSDLYMFNEPTKNQNPNEKKGMEIEEN